MGPPIPEVIGQATYEDGTVLPVRMGDNVQGPCQINFIDETDFNLAENDQILVDEYVYDPATNSGETNYSPLRGIFLFWSGLLGNDDEDGPVELGSIGIRG